MSRGQLNTAYCLFMGIVAFGVGLIGTGPCNRAIGQDTAAAQSQAGSLSKGKQSSADWHTLMTIDGLLPIQVSSVTDDYLGVLPVASTALVLARGAAIVNAGRTGPNGIAQINNVREGRHSVIAAGSNGIGAVGIYVAGKAASKNQPSLSNAALALAPVGEVKLIRDILAKRDRTVGQAAGHVIRDGEMSAVSATGIPQYVLSTDGRISGRFVSTERLAVRASSGLKVTFIRNGHILAESSTDDLGFFQVPSGQVTPGLVSVVATGANGFAIFGAEVHQATLASDGGQSDDGTFPVAFQSEGVNATNMSVADPQAAALVEAALNDIVHSLEGAAPAGGAAAAGVNSGGSGGGGGGGGGILGAAGLGLGAAALGIALDENKSPASPATP